ncbi:MAG TPA: hypothetical protein VM734_36180 [Kofleriaceae bacterium]|nr:hypothetical protein [Kofleriaceae bacterium]
MTRSPYVRRGGDLVLCQPIQNDRVRAFSWFVDADWNALDRLVKRAFTEPSGGAIEVRPLLPIVAVVCADIAHGQSQVPPDKDMGWARERDMGFWVPVARGRDEDGHFRIEQIGWYQPYLFVDNAAGVFTGRETYGFAKMPGTCHMPVTAGERSRFAVDTLVIEHYSPHTEARTMELFRLERSDDGLLGTLESSFDNLLEAALKVQARLLLRAFGPGGLPLPTFELFKNLLEQLTKGLVPMLFLKQFRAVDDPRYACYQAIVEAACDLNGWHGGGFLDEHVLTIAHADSHPIAQDLGLPPGPIETGWGFWAEFDFQVLPGRVLWEHEPDRA